MIHKMKKTKIPNLTKAECKAIDRAARRMAKRVIRRAKTTLERDFLLNLLDRHFRTGVIIEKLYHECHLAERRPKKKKRS